MSIEHLPAWARHLARRYLTRTLSTFVLHGNVRDLQAVQHEGGPAFVSLKRFLADELFAGRDLVVFYDRSGGIRCDTKGQQHDLLRAVGAYDSLHGTTFSSSLPKDPARALQLLENYMRLRVGEGKSLAVVIDFAETVAPAGDVAHMGAEDRFALVSLLKWAHDPQLLGADVSVCLIAENLAELSPRMARSPYVATIEIPLPDAPERRAYVEARLSGRPLADVGDVGIDGLATNTAGLSRIHLGRILTEVLDHGHRLTAGFLKDRKKELIQAEAHGLLEIIEPRFTLDHVAGHEAVKERLRQASRALVKGRLDVMPQGYLFCGPVGTGKTFMATCFAGEVGIPCVQLKNFRSQWQGVTEGNLEKIMTLLKAMWPVAVIIDEADAFLGDRSASGDSGVSQRVFGAIAAFMGDTTWRGKIVWFLLTARPDLLPVDLKRQGRAEEHLPLFHPQTAEELDALFRVLLQKTGARSELESVACLVPEELRLSGADLEAAITRARFRAAAADRDVVTRDDLEQVFADFLPPSYPLAIELQNLVAVQESTSRALLPPAWRDLERDGLTARIRELKVLLGEV